MSQADLLEPMGALDAAQRTPERVPFVAATMFGTSVPWARSTERLFDRLAIGVLAALAVIAILTFRDYGLGWDDYTHAEYGGLLLRLYETGFGDRRALSFVNLYAYGGGFDMFAALAAKVLPFDLFETRRLCGAAVGLIGLAVTWRIGRRFGGSLAGLLALVFLATCPLYYGHMFINAKDSPFAVAMVIMLLGLIRSFEEYPTPSASTVALFGFGLGLSMGTRVLGDLAPLYALAGLSLVMIAEAGQTGLNASSRALRFVLMLLPSLVLAYAVMALIWPWSVVSPLNPLRAVAYFSHFFEKPWKEMFAGVPVAVPDMPRTYVPQLFVLTMPVCLLLLGAAGIMAGVVTLAQRQVAVVKRATILIVILAATAPVVIACLTRPAMYNGIRHFVFLAPPFAVLAGAAGAWVIARSVSASRTAAAIAAAIIAGGILLPIVDMIRLHPYEYTHFNKIAGGVRAADDRYMLDYWGLAFKQAADGLREKLAERQEAPTARARWRIAVCGPQRPAQTELGTDFVTTGDPAGADFAMMLGEFYCLKLNAPILVEVERDGVIFARVYDIRGRSITSLLTLPAP
jgi:Dolichyl-phosphate-mannose-protein mannosyltransferase